MSEALLAQRQIAAGAKANFAGLMALLRSRAGGGLPSITPERLLQVSSPLPRNCFLSSSLT